MHVSRLGGRSRALTALALCCALSFSATVGHAAPVSAPKAPQAALEIAVAPSITGVVTAALTGDPIAGIQVTAYRLVAGQWTAVAQAQTSAAGTYALEGLTAGTYRVGALDWSGSYAEAYYSGAGSLMGASDVVFTGTTVPAISFELTRDPVLRISGADRYATSVEMVYEQYADATAELGVVDFSDVGTVVIASGDERSAADPLAAAGLAYAYQVTAQGSPNAGHGAPLVLVPRSGGVPASVKRLVADIGAGDEGVGIVGNGARRLRLVVVGGTSSVPDAQVAAIEAFARAAGVTVTRDRIAGSDRFDVARRIAERMRARAAESGTDSIQPPTRALIANGADPATFFDALALSPVAARTGSPILLVSAKGVPTATLKALDALDVAGSDVWVAGGNRSVADVVMTRLGIAASHRLAGSSRYATAVAIANKALAAGWLPDTDAGDATGVVVAAKLSDALAGGALAGDAGLGYPLVFAAPSSLPVETSRFLAANRAGVCHAVVLGGSASIGDGAVAGVKAALR